MPDSISPAPSGRAKCRGCGRPIAKGELRFGESVPNAYAEGETSLWFHVPCAALMRPEKFAPLANDAQIPEAERADLRPFIDAGLAHHRIARIVRVERASTGRAHCRHCRELIEKGALRIGLQLMEETRMTPIGFIHASCAHGYFETRETVLARLKRAADGLGTVDEGELEQELSRESPPAVPREAPATPGPGLAKASQGAAEPSEGQLPLGGKLTGTDSSSASGTTDKTPS